VKDLEPDKVRGDHDSCDVVRDLRAISQLAGRGARIREAAPDARALSPGISIGRWGKAGSHGLFIEEFVGFTRQSELVDADRRKEVCVTSNASSSDSAAP
jgi:hypothetical protein